MLSAELLRRILAGYELRKMGTHGVPHWARVLETGIELTDRNGADRQVVELFAVFHDARRVNEGTDPDHGRRDAPRPGAHRRSVAVARRRLHPPHRREDRGRPRPGVDGLDAAAGRERPRPVDGGRALGIVTAQPDWTGRSQTPHIRRFHVGCHSYRSRSATRAASSSNST